jgi:DNA-binding transcriptional regulator of glucitol operon
MSRPPNRRYGRDVYRRFTSPGWIAGHILVLAAVLTCLRLGWWQWDRSQEASGDAQNLGYALLWPAFGAAFVYMWLRFLHLETVKEAEDQGTAERATAELAEELPELLDPPAARAHYDAGQPVQDEPTGQSPAVDEPPAAERHPADPRQRPSTGVTIAVAPVGVDDDDDPELTAYNRALAALAEEDRRRGR